MLKYLRGTQRRFQVLTLFVNTLNSTFTPDDLFLHLSILRNQSPIEQLGQAEQSGR